MKRIFFVIIVSYCSISLSTENIEIITLSPDRWIEYKQLRLRAVTEQPHAFGMSLEDEQARPDAYWKELLKQAEQGTDVWMLFAQREGVLVGMVGALREWNDYGNIKHLVTIANVYVVPEARGKKIAQRLMQELLQVLKEDSSVNQALLWVTCEQAEAIKLYERCGFTISGILSRALKISNVYYDNYLMQCSLEK